MLCILLLLFLGTQHFFAGLYGYSWDWVADSFSSIRDFFPVLISFILYPSLCFIRV